MPLKNLEETIVDRIQRAIAKEVRRLRGDARQRGNGSAANTLLGGEADVMTKRSILTDERRGNP
jgi:hypothetical protein